MPHPAPQARVQEAEETERSLGDARERYRPAAARGSVLFFAVADLASVNPMYQHSLAYFVRLFVSCLGASERSEDVKARVGLVNDHLTKVVLRVVGRGLFEEHKGLFSFMLAAAIARRAGDGGVGDAEWGFFLRGAQAASGGGGGGDAGYGGAAGRPDWLPDTAWRELARLEGTSAGVLGGVGCSLLDGPDAKAWRAWCACAARPASWYIPPPRPAVLLALCCKPT